MDVDYAPQKEEETFNLEIFYKFYLEGESNDSIIKKDYYFILIENIKQLPRKMIKEILIEDGYNPKYLESIKQYQYFYTTNEEYQKKLKDENNGILNCFQVLGEEGIKLDNAKKQLYLHIIINENNGNNENKEEKQKEEYDIKTQLSNIQQISNEIREINRQILNLNQKKEINEEEKNSEGKNTIQNEKNDSNSSKTTNTNMQSKKILYFILEDEFYEKKKEEIKLKPQLNSNFYLTQKLKTLIPSNFDVKFKIFKEEDNFNDFFVKENNLININFLYLGSERIKDKVFDFCGWGKDGNEIKDGDENKNPMKGKVGIKILLLGYIEEKEKIEKITNEYIKNIIYIPKNEEIDFAKEDDYSKKTYNYYFKNYFIEFVHEFMSQLLYIHLYFLSF